MALEEEEAEGVRGWRVFFPSRPFSLFYKEDFDSFGTREAL